MHLIDGQSESVWQPSLSAACGIALVISWAVADARGAEGLAVSTDFEGGSARVIEIDDQNSTVRIAPGGVAERGWVCWWSLRIDHTRPGQRLNLELVASDQPTRNNGQVTKRPLDAG